MFASAAHADTSYRLDMKVLYNGDEIAAPTIVVASEKQADVIVDNPKATSPKMRMLVSAEPGPKMSDGKDTIGVKIMFFESVADAWVVVAEPVIGVLPSVESSVQMGDAAKAGAAHPYEVRLTATLFDPATMSVGGEKMSALGGSGCPSREGSFLFALASVFGISTANAGPGPGCCAVTNVTCCGSTICCNNVNNHLICCSPNP